LLVDDAAALTLATDLLDRYKLPEYRFDKLQTIYNPLNSVKQADLTAIDIADVVSITRTYPTGTPASVTKEYSIENIRHVISPSSHTVEFGLAVADLVYPFTLDDATFGVMDSTNALTYGRRRRKTLYQWQCSYCSTGQYLFDGSSRNEVCGCSSP
jgi:hypothetical protein